VAIDEHKLAEPRRRLNRLKRNQTNKETSDGQLSFRD